MRLERSDLELEVLFRRIEDGEIDLQPDFQRGEIWNRDLKRRLIDSVLRNWYIPPIHIVRDSVTTRDAVLDGQQRLASIRDFFDDQLPIDGSLPPLHEDLMQLHGRHYSELPDEWKRRIRRFPLTVVTLSDYAPEEPYELFFRLNQSYALTPSEKRNALYGTAREQIKSVVKELTSMGLLNTDAVGFDNTRLAYDDVIARTCAAIMRGTLREPISSATMEELYRSDGLPEEVLRDVTAAGEMLKKQLSHKAPSSPRLNKATLFSWLTCLHQLRATKSYVYPYLTARFEFERRDVKNRKAESQEVPPDGWFLAYIAVYNDRASYRVADTFSVLARDVILQLANSYYRTEGVADGIFTPLRLVSTMQNAEEALRDFIEIENWGHLMGGVRW